RIGNFELGPFRVEGPPRKCLSRLDSIGRVAGDASRFEVQILEGNLRICQAGPKEPEQNNHRAANWALEVVEVGSQSAPRLHDKQSEDRKKAASATPCMHRPPGFDKNLAHGCDCVNVQSSWPFSGQGAHPGITTNKGPPRSGPLPALSNPK